MAMTYTIKIREDSDQAIDTKFRSDCKDWFKDNLVGSVEITPSLVHTRYRKVGEELVKEEFRVRIFEFSHKSDALQFKLVFG